jgi:hypothetical protein
MGTTSFLTISPADEWLFFEPKAIPAASYLSTTGRAAWDLPDASIAREGFFVTHFLTVRDQEKSKDFYVRILGGKVIKQENPCCIKMANS